MKELVAAIRDAPDDDAPRMVYADWLMQQGDPRGDYIAAVLRGDPTADERFRNERYAWNKRFLGLRAGYARGLVEMLSGASNNFEYLAADALDDTCVRELVVHKQWPSDPSVEASLRRWLPAMRLRSFAISAAIDAPDLARLLAQLDGLEYLALSTAGDKLEPLLAAHLPRLAGLDVSAGRLGPADVRRIGERFAVRTLDLGINSLAGLPVDALRGVEVLGLYAASLTDTDVVAIVASGLPLRSLELSANRGLGPASARAIAAEPRVAALDYLGLSETQIGPDGVAALVASPYLRRDLELALDGTLLGLSPRYDHDSEGVVEHSYWVGDPPAYLAERFRISVKGRL